MAFPPYSARTAGDPHRLGATLVAGGVNLALWAPEASEVWLCLFDDAGHTEQQRLRVRACRDGVWHGFLAGAGPGLVYGWRVAGRWSPAEGLRFNPQRLLLDPYAAAVVGRYGGDLNRYLGHDPANPDHPHPLDNGALALKARVLAPALPRAVTPPVVSPGQRVIAEVHGFAWVPAPSRDCPQVSHCEGPTGSW